MYPWRAMGHSQADDRERRSSVACRPHRTALCGRSALAALALWAVGCASIEPLNPSSLPGAAVAAAAAAPGYTTLASLQGSPVELPHWWEAIDDALLQDWLRQLLTGNLQLLEAGARIEQARARAGIQSAPLLPTLNLQAQSQRAFQPANAISFNLPAERIYLNNYNIDLTTTWQLDLFGRVRNARASARSQWRASEYDARGLAQSLVAEVVARRAELGAAQRRVQLARNNLQNLANLTRSVATRYRLGARASNAAQVYLARGNEAAAERDLETAERQLATTGFALDVLLGKVPGSVAQRLGDTQLPAMPELPVPPLCLPAAVIEQRPDLAASRARLAAAVSNIHAARADLWPDLGIGASIGVVGLTREGLFSAEQLAGSLFAQITQSLFAGGARRDTVALREAELRELAANYAGQVLDAVREVETALASDASLDRSRRSAVEAIAALTRAERADTDRFVQGVLSLRDLLTTQSQKLQAEQALVEIDAQRWATRVDLLLALGGDWWAEPGSNPTACASQPPE